MIVDIAHAGGEHRHQLFLRRRGPHIVEEQGIVRLRNRLRLGLAHVDRDEGRATDEDAGVRPGADHPGGADIVGEGHEAARVDDPVAHRHLVRVEMIAALDDGGLAEMAFGAHRPDHAEPVALELHSGDEATRRPALSLLCRDQGPDPLGRRVDPRRAFVHDHLVFSLAAPDLPPQEAFRSHCSFILWTLRTRLFSTSAMSGWP